MKLFPRPSCAAATVSLLLVSPGQAGALPDGFVYLKDYVPDIRQEIRYAGRKNFMRKRLPGYNAGECVLTEAAAKALGKVQNAAVGERDIPWWCLIVTGRKVPWMPWLPGLDRGTARTRQYFPECFKVAIDSTGIYRCQEQSCAWVHC